MKKMAIFQVDLNIGGIQKSCVNFLNRIDTTKYEVDLYLVEKENIFASDIKNKINIKYIKKLPYITKMIPFNILKIIYDNKINDEYDVVIDFNSYSNETAIAAIKTKSKKKIMWIHNDIKIKLKEEFKYRLLHFLFKSKYKYFDEFYAVSTGALESFIDMHKSKNKKYGVIPNLINIAEIDEKLKEESDIKIDSKKINVVSVARVTHQKGFDILINTINNIKNDIDNMHFYIIGDGVEFKHIKELVHKYDLEDYITLLGFKENPYNIMNKMDAFILLSRYEGQGMVFLEAAYLGLKVIIPSHLAKYVPELTPTDNIEDTLKNLKKNEKREHFDLKKYNHDIELKINNL